MKNIAIGIQDFKDLRKGNSFYLDKTRQLYNLLNSNTKHYFFSRPRRFGKSLLLSTIKYLFLGEKDLFKNLYIEKKWNFKETNPVMHLSFSSYTDDQDLEEFIKKVGKVCYPDGSEKTIGEYEKFDLFLILKEIKEETGKKTVIVVDEYDKPVLAHLKNTEKAEEVRKFFSNFYAPVKDNDQYIRLFFLTGLTKLMKMSVFSVLNNLDDITFKGGHLDLIGYTQEEMESNFTLEIKEIAKEKNLSYEKLVEKLKIDYNGFNFGDDSLKLYNPWDINNFFVKKQFGYYWADTGIPSAISNYIETSRIDVKGIINLVRNNELALDDIDLRVQDLKYIKSEVLFLNSGYLTIREIFNDQMYYLKFPNRETEQVMMKYFLNFSYKNSINADKWLKISDKIVNAIFNKDKESLQSSIHFLIYDILSSTPYDWLTKNPEGWFKTLLGVAIRMNSIYYWPETQNILGRIDFHIPKDNIIYVLEVKINESTKKAITQIDEKYTAQYKDLYQEVVRIGVNWNKKRKKVEVEIKK